MTSEIFKKGRRAAYRESSADSQTPSWLLPLVKLLLVLLILFMLPKLVFLMLPKFVMTAARRETRRRHRRTAVELRQARWACQVENPVCSTLIPEESMNCVNECVSPDCYENVYSPNPLENGEINIERAKQFQDCVKEELRIVRKNRKAARDEKRASAS
jgi:hypothetical protein